jgi:hypothetical protein
MSSRILANVPKGGSAAANLFKAVGYRKAMARRLLLITLTLVATLTTTPATLHADEVDDVDTSEYVEVFDGDMPLMFAVGHGGWKQVGEQTNGGYSADPLLQNYFYQVLAKRIWEKTGHLPYIVYEQGNRNYVNTNREIGRLL